MTNKPQICTKWGPPPSIDSSRPAVLVCNGPSAEDYKAAAGEYVMCINGGFRNRPAADAAITVDCPRAIMEQWRTFGGYKIVPEHNATLPYYHETLDCLELVRKYRSAAAPALLWLSRQGFEAVTIVGMDALLLAGKSGALYTAAGHAEFLSLFAERFGKGLYVVLDGRKIKVDRTFLSRYEGYREADERHAGKLPVEKVEPQKPCTIPQTMVEFDPSPRCTRACSFCAPGIPKGRRKSKQRLKLADHNRVIDQLVDCGYNKPDRWLAYCGHGEPLLNPDLFKMIRYAREKLPANQLVVYTNGDQLTVDDCCTFEALDIDVLVWDCYDAANGKRVPPIIAASSLDPARVRVNDYRKGFAHPSSRCSTVGKGDAAAWKDRPCKMPAGKLFFTDNDGGGSRWLLCCECYDRRDRWDGKLSPEELNADESFAMIIKSVAQGKRDVCGSCAKCDRDGNHPSGFAHVPALADSPLWPCVPIIPTVKGRRLVVIATNDKWSDHAAVVADTIDKASVMDGDIMILWGDDNVTACPKKLKGYGRIIKEYPEALGWCGINRGFADAYKYAIKHKYDWVIKLDTDTAILKHGWDALLCSECPRDSQIGTYMDASITGQIEQHNINSAGLFTELFDAHCRWSRGLLRRGLRRWDHMQGGCYVIGYKALARIDKIVGLSAADQENIPERERIGEDVYIDTKCKIAKVPQRDTLLLRIWFRSKNALQASMPLEHIRHQRDSLGVVAVHPVKDLAVLRGLSDEI